MPTYEYICQKCGHKFELFQSMAADALTVCPKDQCPKKRWGKGEVKRVIGTGAGFLFKGSGFYETDYRSENYKAAAKRDSLAATSSSSSSKPAKKEAKTESKTSKPTPTPV